MTEIQRYKDEADLSADELLAVTQARHRGEPVPKFETDEYAQRKADALRLDGLDTEADELEAARTGGAVPVDEMTTDEHFDRVRSTR